MYFYSVIPMLYFVRVIDASPCNKLVIMCLNEFYALSITLRPKTNTTKLEPFFAPMAINIEGEVQGRQRELRCNITGVKIGANF